MHSCCTGVRMNVLKQLLAEAEAVPEEQRTGMKYADQVYTIATKAQSVHATVLPELRTAQDQQVLDRADALIEAYYTKCFVAGVPV